MRSVKKRVFTPIANESSVVFDKLKVAMVFALELKLSKTLRGLVYFVLQ